MGWKECIWFIQNLITAILLLPGVYERWDIMEPIARLLSQHGYTVHTVKALGLNRGSVEEMASLAKKYLNSLPDQNYIIIAHSKGGLIGKYLMSHYDTKGLIKGMIALNTPFQAHLMQN